MCGVPSSSFTLHGTCRAVELIPKVWTSDLVAVPPPDTHEPIARLDWDSRHFGFPVGRIAPHYSTDAELRQVLRMAKRDRYRLLFLVTAENDSPSDELLAEFRGRLVDRRARFERSLVRGERDSTSRTAGCCVRSYTAARLCPSLIELAVQAGGWSRFSVDPDVPREKFVELYRIWIERSVRREIANEVLVAETSGPDRQTENERDEAEGAELAGMVTLSAADGAGSIGLIAVSPRHRGQGVGSSLMEAAHDWMRAQGAERASIITQMANEPACRLYRRTGYALASVQNYFHFWP